MPSSCSWSLPFKFLNENFLCIFCPFPPQSTSCTTYFIHFCCHPWYHKVKNAYYVTRNIWWQSFLWHSLQYYTASHSRILNSTSQPLEQFISHYDCLIFSSLLSVLFLYAQILFSALSSQTPSANVHFLIWQTKFYTKLAVFCILIFTG